MILCSGVIGSAHLLLLSGIGDFEHLNLFQGQIPLVQHLPGVGYNLQDHVASYGLTWTTKGKGNAYNPFLYTVDPRTYFNWKVYGTGDMNSEYLDTFANHSPLGCHPNFIQTFLY